MKISYKILLLLSLMMCLPLALDAKVGKGTRAARKTFFDLRFGMTFSDIDIKGGNRDKETKLGVHLEMLGAYKFYKGLFIQSGLGISKKGLRQNEYRYGQEATTGIEYLIDRKTNVNLAYIEVPLKFGYEHYFNENLAMNVALGGYLGYGFKGKSKIEGEMRTTGQIEEILEDYDTGKRSSFQDNRFKRIDAGFTGSAVLVYDIYQVSIAYDYGLLNVIDLKGQDMKNRALYISFGFRF